VRVFAFVKKKLNYSFSSNITILINLYLKYLAPVSQELGLMWNFLYTIQITNKDHPTKGVSIFRWLNVPQLCYILVTWVRNCLKNQAGQESINLCPLWEFSLISLAKLLPRLCVWVDTGFGLVNGFIDHLYTQLGTTSNYSATANIHNSQIITAPAKSFQPAVSSPAFPRQRLLSAEILQFHVFRFYLHSCPCRTLPNCQLNYSAVSSLPLL
jgi:hypothetical protein